jgi:hypothetical protein
LIRLIVVEVISILPFVKMVDKSSDIFISCKRIVLFLLN